MQPNQNTQQPIQDASIVFCADATYFPGLTIFTSEYVVLSITVDDYIRLVAPDTGRTIFEQPISDIARVRNLASSLSIKFRNGKKYRISADANAMTNTQAIMDTAGSGAISAVSDAKAIYEHYNEADKQVGVPLLNYLKSKGVTTSHVTYKAVSMYIYTVCFLYVIIFCILIGTGIMEWDNTTKALMFITPWFLVAPVLFYMYS